MLKEDACYTELEENLTKYIQDEESSSTFSGSNNSTPILKTSQSINTVGSKISVTQGKFHISGSARRLGGENCNPSDSTPKIKISTYIHPIS